MGFQRNPICGIFTQTARANLWFLELNFNLKILFFLNLLCFAEQHSTSLGLNAQLLVIHNEQFLCFKASGFF